MFCLRKFFRFYTQSPGTIFQAPCQAFWLVSAWFVSSTEGHLFSPPHPASTWESQDQEVNFLQGPSLSRGPPTPHICVCTDFPLKDIPSVPRQSTARRLHDWHCVLYILPSKGNPISVKTEAWSMSRQYNTVLTIQKIHLHDNRIILSVYSKQH